MILFGLEIMVATYVGTRVVEKLKTTPTKMPTKNLAPQSKKIQNLPIEEDVKTNQKEPIDTYLKISTASIGLTTIGYLYAHFLIPLGIAVISYAIIPTLRKTEENLFSKQRKIDNNLLNEPLAKLLNYSTK